MIRKNKKKKLTVSGAKLLRPRYRVLYVSVVFYRKIHYLTREFHVKLHAKTDIGFQGQFNVEFTSQVMNFP